MELIVQVVILGILLLCSALFSGLETSFYSVSRLTIRGLLKAKHPGAEALHYIKQHQRRMIITILVGNNIVNIAASAIATSVAITLYGSTGVGIATGVMTFLVLIFGEITPKNFASVYAEKIALFSAKPLKLLMLLMRPLTLFFEVIIIGMHKVVGNQESEKTFSEEKLRTFVEIGTEEQVLERTEKEMIEGALEFNDITTKEVMTPRVKMFALDGKMKIKDSLPIINKEGYSRIPLYEKQIDNIIGFIHIKDILLKIEQKKLHLPLKSILRKPIFTSQERVISQLFKEMQAKKTHLAVVVDEHGGTEGIVTIEDLLEELVGEIMDESDLSPEMIMRIDKNTIIVHADTEIDKVNHFFHINLPKKGKYYTIAGLMHEELKRIPRKNAQVKLDNLTLKVMADAANKPLKVKIMKVSS